MMSGGEESARQIDLERFVPAVERNARRRHLLAVYARVVEVGYIRAARALGPDCGRNSRPRITQPPRVYGSTP